MRDATLQTLPIRLLPGDDLRQAIEQTVRQQGVAAAFVIAGIGSLRAARIRLAGADTVSVFDGDTEMFTLSGTSAAQGSHLHLSIADAQGRVIGGHAAEGCIVRTTAEVLLGLLPGWRFERVFDPARGMRNWLSSRIRPAKPASATSRTSDRSNPPRPPSTRHRPCRWS
jgi:uncharacterized protein